MRRIIAVLLLASALLIALCVSVNAHSGRTDSNGGHLNHYTGEYHYHHGYPAHDHPNGVCPYKQEKKYEQEDNRATEGFVWILALGTIGVIVFILCKKKK